MEGSPNILSTLAFFSWIPICLWGMRRWPPARAGASLYFGGMLLLPELVHFKLPGLPAFDKHYLMSFWLFVGVVLFHRERLRSAAFGWQFKVCVVFLTVGGTATVLLNSDALTYGSSYIPGHVPYDAFHLIIRNTLSRILPFVVAMSLFQSRDDLRTLFQVLVSAAVLYSVLQIVELIISPQLNRMLYGYHQHSFFQTVRGGGFRPMVFMGHGLALAMFTSLAIIASAALFKTSVRVFDRSAALFGGYLYLVLSASKSLAAVLYTTIAVPLVVFVSPRKQVVVAAVLASLLFAYPAARAMDLIPVDDINAFVLERYGVDKVGSLTVRFENEAEMLEKGLERIWFGWGSNCRACLFDPWSGDLLSIRDGAWVSTLGDNGVIGYIGHFGLIAFPIFVVLRRFKAVRADKDRRLLAALSLMVGICVFDLIPNGNFNTLVTFMSGALIGSFAGIVRETALARRQRRAARLEAARTGHEVPA